MRKSRILTAALMGALALGLVYCSGTDGNGTGTDGGTPSGKADASSSGGADAEQQNNIPADASNVPADASNVGSDASNEPPDASNEPPDASSSGSDAATAVTCGTPPTATNRGFTVTNSGTAIDFSGGNFDVDPNGTPDLPWFYIYSTDSKYVLEIDVDTSNMPSLTCPASDTAFPNAAFTYMSLYLTNGSTNYFDWTGIADSVADGSGGETPAAGTLNIKAFDTTPGAEKLEFECNPDCTLGDYNATSATVVVKVAGTGALKK